VDEEFLEFVGEVLEEVLRVGALAYKIPADELITNGVRQAAGLHNEVIKLLFFVHAGVVYMDQVVDTYADIIHEQGVQNFLLAIKILVDSGFGNFGFFGYLVYAGLVITKLAE